MLAQTAAEQRQTIGERTLLQRRRRGISQRNLSAQLGWGLNRISHVERCRTSLSIIELYQLADALSTTADYLMGLTDTPTRRRSSTVEYRRHAVSAGQTGSRRTLAGAERVLTLTAG